MIFASLEFLLAFLPLTLLGFMVLRSYPPGALGWLVLASLVFYAWWEPVYLLFVCFFPQLIAGPIVHHQEMIPQFQQPRDAATRLSDVQVGLTVLVIGLFKKVVIADELAEVATPIFAVAETGGSLSM